MDEKIIHDSERMQLPQVAWNIVACKYQPIERGQYSLPDNLVEAAKRYLLNLLIKSLEDMATESGN
jgi:hypothetical protein